MRSAHLKVRLIRVLSKENKAGDEEASTLKLITDAVVSTLGQLLTEVWYYCAGWKPGSYSSWRAN